MKKEEILIMTDDVRVRVMELPPGTATPYHHHTELTDFMFGLEGEITVVKKTTREEVRLAPGNRCTVEAGEIHRVANGSQTVPAKYLLVQGVGTYDFMTDQA